MSSTTLAFALATALLVAVLLACTGSARAAFPGKNGVIASVEAYKGRNAIVAATPNGKHTGPLVASPKCADDRSRQELEYSDPSFAPSGRVLVFAEQDRCSTYCYCPVGLFTVQVQGLKGSHVRAIPHSKYDERPHYSPDGRRIVFERRTASDATGDVFMMNKDGSHVRQLTHIAHHCDTSSAGIGDADNPTFFPNGKRIAFDAQVCSDPCPPGYQPPCPSHAIWTMNLNGSNRKRITPPMQACGGGFTVCLNDLAACPDVSPDARRIIFADEPHPADFQVYAINADGTGRRQLTHAQSPNGYGQGTASCFNAESMGRPVYSPDGRRIVTGDGGLMNADGSHLRFVNYIGTWPTWQHLRRKH